MRKRVKLISSLLIVLMVITVTMTGCKSENVADAQPAENAFVTVCVHELLLADSDNMPETAGHVPEDGDDVYIWAWKDGGENAFEEWPGIPVEPNYEGGWISASVPAWIDRLIISTRGGAVQTAELSVDPGKDVWIVINGEESDVFYEDIFAGIGISGTVNADPFYQAAELGDFEAMKSMLSDIADRSILTDWVFNDFNYDYALDAFRAGDYETAIEFLGYCAYEKNQLYAEILALFLSGDLETAIDVIKSMDFTELDQDLGMSWAEIIGAVTGFEEDAYELELALMDRYLTLRLGSHEPSFSVDSLVFGDSSAWMSENYIGEITGTDHYLPIENINTLKSQCGSEADGKILILHSRMVYPQNTTCYAVDLNTMRYLSSDLYPASLSEVEYIITVSYEYTVEGEYKQTFSVYENSVEEYFTFLRMKGQVQLENLLNGKAMYSSPWIEGTGEVKAHFSDNSYQCSNMPETGDDIFRAVEKVREMNGAEN